MIRSRKTVHITRWLYASLIIALLWSPFSQTAQAAPLTQSEGPGAGSGESDLTANCALLDDPVARSMMSGAFETALLYACGRAGEVGAIETPPALEIPSLQALGDDVQVNNPSGDVTTMTQLGSSIAYNPVNNILCTAYYDSYHGVVQGTGFTGFSSSSNGGAAWTDHGSLVKNGTNVSNGYPSLAWRRADRHFYIATLHSTGLGLWDLGTDCASSTWVGKIHTSFNDDRVMLSIDNNPASPYYGRMYAAWTDFSDWHIYASRSSDGGQIWGSPADASGHDQVNGAWQAVDPVTGDIYIAWTHWDVYPAGPIDIEIIRSTDGGGAWTPLTNPLDNGINPRDAAATTSCTRPALNGGIRYSPYAQIAVDQNSTLHVVYSRDPDSYNSGDVVNVYYRRSNDQGATWETEMQVNSNWGYTDQFNPTLAVGEDNIVAISWFDRRNDSTDNLLYDRYLRVSHDGGLNFGSDQRISDQSSPIVHDPLVTPCFEGDNDQLTMGNGYIYVAWGDNRSGNGDIWSDSEPYFWEQLSGTVYDAATKHGLANAHVESHHAPTGMSLSAASDATGYYQIAVPEEGIDTVTAQVYGYLPNTVEPITVPGGFQADIPLSAASFWDINGQVTDGNTGYPLRAHLTVTGDPIDPPAPDNETWSDSQTGNYTLAHLAESIAYTIKVEAEGYIAQSLDLAGVSENLYAFNFTLQPDLVACSAPGYELSGGTCQVISGAALQPDPVNIDACPCEAQTQTLHFVNHSGFDDEILITYQTSPGISVLEIPQILGTVSDSSSMPFDVQMQLDRGTALNATASVTITASLAGHPAVTDQAVITLRSSLLQSPWEAQADAPVTAFMRGAGAALDDYAYVIGGQNNSASSGKAARYRPSTGWQALDDKPTPAANIDAAELNGKIYVAGGYGGGTRLDTLEVLDPSQPAGEQWSTIAANLPAGVSGGAMAAACDKIYFMGGSIAGDVSTAAAYAFDPNDSSPSWDAITAMPSTQRYASAVSARGLIFSIGDWDTGTLVQVYNCATNTWLTGYPQLNSGHNAPGTAIYQNRYIITYGGSPTMGFVGVPDVEILDLDNLAAGWQVVQSMGQGRMGPGGGISEGKLVAVGGYDESGHATNTVETADLCPGCDCGVSVEKTASSAQVTPGELVTYNVVVKAPNTVNGSLELVDPLPAGADFSGDVSATYGTATYSSTDNAIHWSLPAGTYQNSGAGSEIETFSNTWSTNAVGLTYNAETGFTRYAHEGTGPKFIHDIAASTGHPVLHSFNLSDANPGWSTLEDWRSGAGYDVSSGHYFLTDYGGGGTHDDNFVEVDPVGKVLNAWETDGASNDSYDGSTINNIFDIAVVPGHPSRYFVTAFADGGNVYELNLIQSGKYVSNTWGIVKTCTVPGLNDAVGIDYDAQNNVLYLSSWNNETVAVTDLNCNVLETFTCSVGISGRNSAVTFIEGQWPPEVWVNDSNGNQTARCQAVGHEPHPEEITISYTVEASAPVATTVTNTAVLSCGAAGCADPSAPSILLIRTEAVEGSLQRALDELGYSYDSVYAGTNWTSIDFAPYDIIVIGINGGTVSAASVQKIRTDVIDQGKRAILFGGTQFSTFANSVNQYLVQNNTASYNWIVTAAPNFTLSNPDHSLAQGLPASYNFVNASARYYMLRATDPTLEVLARNGENQPSYFRKAFASGGDLVWFIHAPQTDYWSNPGDYALLKRVASNTLAQPRKFTTSASFNVVPAPNLTWLHEVYVNGVYVGQSDGGPFTAAPGDEVQIVERLEYVGGQPLFVELARNWTGQPATLAAEAHSRGAVQDGTWYVTLSPGESESLVKTLNISGTAPVTLTDTLRIEGKPDENRQVVIEPPVFTKVAPGSAEYDEVIDYTLTLQSHDPLFGAMTLVDTLPADLEYVGDLSASYGEVSYNAGNHTITWTNTPAASLTLASQPLTSGSLASELEPGVQSADVLGQEAQAGPLSALNTSESQPSLLNAASATWASAASMPHRTVRYAHAQCPGEPNRFYVIAGVTSPSTFAEVKRYDAELDRWTVLSPMPESLEGPAAVCYQGMIYAAGGGGTNRFFIYDIVHDVWTEGPALPRRVWGAAIGAWEGQLYLAGGDSDFSLTGQSAEVDIYNIVSSTWRTNGAPLPVAVSAPGWVQVNQYLYVVGGWGDTSSSNLTATQRYDMTSNTWETGPAFTSARADFTLAATGQYLYAIGGDANNGGFFDHSQLVERLDYTAWPGGTWTDISDPIEQPTSAFSGGFCTMARSGGEVWSVGGISTGWIYTSSSQYRPSEACVQIPSSVTITFKARVKIERGQSLVNTAALDFRGSSLTASNTTINPQLKVYLPVIQR